MAADVSSLVRTLSGRKEDGEGKRDLITRDLLGGAVAGGSAVLGSPAKVDLESSWERRLDLLSYPQKTGSRRQMQDLNLPPPPPSAASLPEDSAALDLKLVAAPSSAAVCTLEKVKLALERAERETRGKQARSPSPPLSSTTTSSVRRRDEGEEEGQDSEAGGGGGGMMAAACPRCLFYVLISKSDPRCPRCDCHVPVPAYRKRPRIDLNATNG